ncbi:hypothetical protein [Streptomyces hygroscopicus]|uniref:hypothetical protein n=1 Tax=Streptomyces hygroscopicus TaxID=1912 RepID=UPI001FCB9C66|nr:hypothetical protein [Streptomyces hygroscopicus]BDH14867.1 hypothetical protein HOK021_60460 [Streptomyces hygroscopicus]
MESQRSEEEMGELADRVAGLEREVAEAREALRVVEKVDEELENAMEEVESVNEVLRNLSWELDGEVADHDYAAVEGLAYELWNPVDSEQLRRAVDTIALLTAVRDGRSLPTVRRCAHERSERRQGIASHTHPRGTRPGVPGGDGSD